MTLPEESMTGLPRITVQAVPAGRVARTSRRKPGRVR